MNNELSRVYKSVGFGRAQRGSNEYRVEKGLLYKRMKYDTDTMDDFVLVVPNRFRRDLLVTSHDTFRPRTLGLEKPMHVDDLFLLAWCVS